MATKVENNIKLADYTSFGVGGAAEFFVITENSVELLEALESNKNQEIQILGYGSNVLISDSGLTGLVICNKGGKLSINENEITVDAGVWWDEVVQTSIENGLWGIELLSEIPGSVGGALFINIAAYGQSIGRVVKWIDVWDKNKQNIKRLTSEELTWGYKSSLFQENHSNFVIIKACLKLSREKLNDLTYQKTLDTANELGLDINNLNDRRKIIIETRIKAGSIWHPNNPSYSRTVGSFFRNPEVTPKQAEQIISYDETGKTKTEIQNMNKVHGGKADRVSAAHVMLACGFRRGHAWDNVKLNDQNLLKIEALNGATAQDIFNVITHIQKTCKSKLNVDLQPEAQILGDFR